MRSCAAKLLITTPLIMQFRLRTLLILLAVSPPLIGYWPAIKRHAAQRATQISACDVVVVAAFSTLVAMRWRLDRFQGGSSEECVPSDQQRDSGHA